MAMKMADIFGLTICLLTGMILQVMGGRINFGKLLGYGVGRFDFRVILLMVQKSGKLTT